MSSLSSSTLRERIADNLRESIIRGDLKPGERLQELEISAAHNTSRTPVREALQTLESEGFLIIRPRRGAFVAPITEKDVYEFYEIKSLLEGHAAKLATPRLSEDQIQRMQWLNNRMQTLYAERDYTAVVPVHNEFHEIFVRACGNDRLISLVQTLVKQFQRFRIVLSHTQAVEESVRIHEEIILAFRQRDAGRAERLVAENSLSGCASLVQTLRKVAVGDQTAVVQSAAIPAVQGDSREQPQ